MTQPYYPDRREVLKQIVTGSAAFAAGSTLVAQDAAFAQQPAGNSVPPKLSQDRLPMTQSATNTPGTYTMSPVVSPSANADPASFRTGYLELTRYNHIVLAATERAVLTSLKTEQRDAAGNIIQDNEGNPIMIPVRKGMNVFEGQVLGIFDDRELRSTKKINEKQLEVAYAELGKEIEVRYAAQGVRVAMAELKSMEEANKNYERAFPAVDMIKGELAVAQAEANLELQKYTLEEIKTREVEVRKSELERTEVLIGLRQLKAPIGGMLTEIYAAEGVWLREGDPVLEIMQLDTLWVRKQYNALQYEIRDLLGKQVTVNVTLARGRVETVQGTVFHCSPKILSNDIFEVYVEVQNRRAGDYWLLQPGHKADIVLPS